MTRDFHFDAPTARQRLCKRIHHASGGGVQLGRARGERDLLALQHGTNIFNAVLCCGQRGERVKFRIIADNNLIGFALTQLV